MSIPFQAICILGFLSCIAGVYRFWMLLRSGRKEYEIGTCKTIGSREIQTNYFTVEESENGILAVLAAGMGREAGGRIAAKTVIHIFEAIFAEYNMLDHPTYFFRKAFLTANREILKQMDDGRGMAAVSAVMIQKGFLYYGLVGNVKVAVFRNHELISLGTGHTVDVLAEDKYYQGVLSREDALAMLHEKRTYNYLGKDGFKEIEFYDKPIALRKADIVMLFSNGIYENVAWKKIEEHLSGRKSCKKLALDLIEQVNQKKGDKNNASVILMRIGDLT